MIVSYDPRWAEEYERERVRLAGSLGAFARRIDHHGSTAVPGLDAKPIIDIQISVDHLLPMDAYRQPLESLGYRHVPHPDDAFCPFFHRPACWPHTHHVHVVELGGDEERRTLAFRDYLRHHGDAATEYAALKRRLASSVDWEDRSSRERYTRRKARLITDIVGRALAAGFPLRDDT